MMDARDTVATDAPFDSLRRRLNLSYREFAAVLGVPFSTVYNACAGLSVIPRKATAALQELGVDPKALAQEQRDWLAARGAARRAALREKLGVSA